MKRITTIEENLQVIQPKLDSQANDWTKEEKKVIAECYFEITKVSVGFGRSLDVACGICVESAANLIRNYQALVAQEEDQDQEQDVIKLDVDWKATLGTVDAKALELSEKGFEFSAKKINKETKIAEIETFLAVNAFGFDTAEEADESEENESEENESEYTPEQLVEIIRAKTGEELDPLIVSYDELLAKVKSFESENNDGDQE